MRWLYLVAAILCLATGVMHAFFGGIETLNPMMASTISMEVRVTMMVIWHAITVVFVLSVAALLWAFRAKSTAARPIGLFVGTFYLVFAGLFASLSFFWFEDLMVLPQWTLLAPVGLFAILASI